MNLIFDRHRGRSGRKSYFTQISTVCACKMHSLFNYSTFSNLGYRTYRPQVPEPTIPSHPIPSQPEKKHNLNLSLNLGQTRRVMKLGTQATQRSTHKTPNQTKQRALHSQIKPEKHRHAQARTRTETKAYHRKHNSYSPKEPF